MISDRCKLLNPSPTLAINARAKQMQADGIDVLSFGAGEPDFDTPDFVKEAAIEAMRAGFNRYTPSAGIPELKQVISEKFWRDNQLKYDPNQVIATVGAKHAIFNALMTVCNPGDEVILIAPYWATYAEQVSLAGAIAVIVKTDESSKFCPSYDALRAAITPKTKALILNSPNNPTGAVYSRATMKEIAALAIRHNFWIISDEIYEKIIYDDIEHVSIASLGKDIYDRTITVNGVSKCFSMTGWRLGYLGAPLEIAKAISNLQDSVTSNPTSFVQKGAVKALTADDSFVIMMRIAFDERRRFLVPALSDMPGLEIAMPQGAYYAFPNITKLIGLNAKEKVITDGASLVEYLLEDARIAVVPGNAFDAPNNFRFSFAANAETIHKGIERMGAALAKLK